MINDPNLLEISRDLVQFNLLNKTAKIFSFYFNRLTYRVELGITIIDFDNAIIQTILILKDKRIKKTDQTVFINTEPCIQYNNIKEEESEVFQTEEYEEDDFLDTDSESSEEDFEYEEDPQTLICYNNLIRVDSEEMEKDGFKVPFTVIFDGQINLLDSPVYKELGPNSFIISYYSYLNLRILKINPRDKSKEPNYFTPLLNKMCNYIDNTEFLFVQNEK